MVRFDEEQYEYIMSNLAHCPYAMTDHDFFVVMEMLRDYRNICKDKPDEKQKNIDEDSFVDKARLKKIRHDDIEKCRFKAVDILSPETTKAQHYTMGKLIGRIELLNDLIDE